MSSLGIAHYFPFLRVRILYQKVSGDAKKAYLEVVPNKRFRPICHLCGRRGVRVHIQERRWVRDLDFGPARVCAHCHYRKIVCARCQEIPEEELDLFDPYLRVTRRLARYIFDLSKIVTVQEVSHNLGLEGKTVKAADQKFLEEAYGKTDYQGLRILAFDEITIRKEPGYLTMVLGYESGRMVWFGKDRKVLTLRRFFSGMTSQQRKQLDAVVMDMWGPYIVAVQSKVPHVKIVFDLFHGVAQFSWIIERVRNREYRKASRGNKAVFKGPKYLLLKNRSKTCKPKDRELLEELLQLNKVINTVLILKDKLKPIWTYRSRKWRDKAISERRALAKEVNHPAEKLMASMICAPFP